MSTKKISQKREASSAPGDDVASTEPVSTNTAKKQMCSLFDEDPPPPVRKIRALKGGEGANTSLCKIQGVVTRTKDETVNTPRGPMVKKRIDIVVVGVTTNGAQDIVTSGIEGEVFIFPSKVDADTPESAEAAGDKFKAKQRSLLVSPNSNVRQLSTFSSNFYKDSKEGGDAGVNSAFPGMMVEVTGVCVNPVTKNGTTNFYLNGGKVVLLDAAPPSAGDLAAKMIALNKQDRMARWSAFSASRPLKGFFDEATVAALNPAQREQALACQALWHKLVEGVAERLGNMAQKQEEDVAAQLSAHEQRVRATPPHKLADGNMNLFFTDAYDSTIAPVVQSGIRPWNRTPELIQLLQEGPESQVKVPHTFTAPWVVNVECTGKTLSVDMRVAYVFDKPLAIKALQGEHSPVLASKTAAIPITLSLRELGFKFGTLLESKVVMAARELIPVSEFAAFPKVFASQDGGGNDAIQADFPEGGTLYIDVAATLRYSSVLVSTGFVKSNLCGGGSQFVPPKVKADVTKLEFLPGVTEMPDLETFYYQELTYSSFDLSNWEEDIHAEFRIVYPGVVETLKNNPSAATDAAKGEAFMKTLGHDTTSKMKQFLTQECLVYAVLSK